MFSCAVDLNVIHGETTEATDLTKTEKKTSEQNTLEITKETYVDRLIMLLRSFTVEGKGKFLMTMQN